MINFAYLINKPIALFRYLAMILCILTLSVSQMWGDNQTFSGSDFNVPTTKGNITLSVPGTNGMTYNSSGSGSLNTSGAGKSFTLTGTSGATISQVVITGNNTGSDRFSTSSVSPTPTTCSRSSGVTTCTFSTAQSSITFSTTGGGISISEIAVTYSSAAATYKLGGSWNSYSEHTMNVSAGVASYSVDLAADTRYEFYFKENSTTYKNNGTILAPVTDWGFSTSDNNAHIHTGPAGTYTFTMNTSTHAVSVTYPEVTHPNDHYVYFKNASVWGTVYAYLANSGNDNKAAAWPGCPTPTTTICNETYHYAAMNSMSGTYNLIIFNNGGSGSGNQSWNLSTTGSAGNYNANADANWYDPSYEITFDANGGSGTMNKVVAICSGADQTLPDNTFTRTGWEFDGWNTNKYGTGTSYDDGDEIENITADIKLYAQWKKTVYLQSSVSWWYNDNAWFAVYCFDSDADTNNKWVKMTRAEECSSPAVYKVTLPGNGFDKVVFCRMNAADTETLAWSNKDNQTANIAYPTTNDKFTISNGDNGQACTGSWGTYSAPTFTISYNKGSTTYTGDNSISGSKDNESKTCEVDFTLPTVVFTTTGYTQTGWATSDGGSKAYELGGKYTTDAAQTFYPAWTVQSFTLTWNLAGGTVTTAGTGADKDATGTPSSLVNYGAAITKPTVTKTGYNFAGWDETPASTMPASNTTYTATWTAQEYSITYLDEGGDSYSGSNEASLPDTHTYGSATALVEGVKEGYTFVGWYEDEDCDGDAVTSIGATDYTDDITLYAKWEASAEGYYLINQSTGAINTTDYFTGVASTSTDASPKTIKDKSSLSKYISFSTAITTPGANPTDSYVQYDVKTTSTTIYVYAYNTYGSGSKTIYLREYKEGKGSGETKKSKSIAKSSGDTLVYNATNTTNSTIYITVNSTDVKIYQVVAVESGTALTQPGDDGYSMSFVKGRHALADGSLGRVDGIEIVPSADYTAATTTYASITTKNTNYIKFTPTEDCYMTVFTANDNAYYVSTSKGDVSGTAYTGSRNNIALTGSTTYYINPNGNEVQISKILFRDHERCFEITDARKKGSTYTLQADTVVPYSTIEGTIFGGQFKKTGGSPTGNQTHGIVFDANNDEYTVTLWGNKVLAEGSVISITQHGNGTTGTETGFKISGNSMSPETYTNTIANEENTQTYTVPAESPLIGSNSFTITRAAANTVYLYSMYITGCDEVTGHTVTYDGNGATGGSVPTDDNTYETGDEVTVLGNTGSLEKTGYQFDGWSDGVNTYDEDDTFEMPNEDVTLTAVWTANTYSITYNLNSGSWVNTGSATYTYGVGYTLPTGADLTKTNYTFIGWFDNEDLEGSAITAIAADATGDKEYWAKWGATRTIAWYVDGSTYSEGTPTTATCQELGITTMPTAPSALSCSDVFRGWSTTNLEGDATDTPPAVLFTNAAGAPSIDGNKTFYAVFANNAAVDATSFTTTFTSKAWADDDSKWTSGKDGYAKNATQGVQISTGVTGANATTKAEYKAVTKVVVTYSTNASSGAGSIEIKVGDTSVSGSADVTKTGGTDDRTINYIPVSSLDGKVKITVNTTDGSIYIKSVQIFHSGSFVNYRCVCPSVTVTPKLVTSGTPIFITSAANKSVRSQDTLHISGSGFAKSATLTLKNLSPKFTLKSATNGAISTDATGSIDTDAFIFYNPGTTSTDGLDKNADFVITDGKADVEVDQPLIGRHLPANFVIAAKNGDTWYALPANMGQGDAAANRAPVEIEVDNSTTPTSAITTEANVYSLEAVPAAVHNRDSGEFVILLMHGKNNYPLYGNPSTAPVGSSAKYVINNLDKNYWWALTQKTTSITNASDATYNMSVANGNANNPLKIWLNAGGTGVPYWGLYNSASNIITEIRLIPWSPHYMLAWNTNGGSDLDCDECTSGLTVSGTTIVAPSDPTLSNYTFDGWNTANDGSGSAAAATMPSADVTYYAAWKQTLTLTTGSQGSGANQTPYVYLNGTSASSFTAHSADGYSLQGYYTAGSGGTKVLNADGSFAADDVTGFITDGKWSRTGAAPTLYAQWLATDDCRTLKYAWKVTGKFCDDESTSVTSSDTVRFPANASNLYFTESGTGNTVSKGSSYNIGKTQNNYFLLTAKSGYEIKSICFYGKIEDSSVDYTTDGSLWLELESTSTSGDDYYSFNNINASAFGIKLTAESPKGIWIRNMVIEICSSGGITYNVTYDGNDNTSGDAPEDDEDYDYGDAVTVIGNTGSLAKTNYTFAGWTTNDDGTGSNYVADNTFSITDNTTLYAKWTQGITFDANTANHGSTGGSATAVWNATGLTSITHAKPASGYKLLGYYTAATSGTKVLNSDGSFADTDVTGYITDGKWARTGEAATLYAQYEVSGALTWNLTVNSGSIALGTETKTSAFTEISTSNMTNAAAVGVTTTVSAKKNLTGKISTPASYDADKYVKVTFKVASGYKFTPSSIKVKAQPVSTGKDVRLSLTDGTNTITMASDSAVGEGKTKEVVLAGDGTYFTDSVTLKIYCFGATDDYRLGTPITIEGAVEATCTMPGHSGLDYEQTEYIKDASASAISVVSPTNVTTYAWKQNTSNDRSGGTAASGTNNTVSYTPSTSSTGTMYYWCELTNDCGTVKTPAVAITVSASKSTASVTWDSKAKLNSSDTTAYIGGKNYTIHATTTWDGTLTSAMMTAPTGIRLHDFTIDNSSNPKSITATFDVQTAFDIDEHDSIAFALSLPATATYNALSSEKKVAYNECSGGGGGADEYLMPVNADSINNSAWKGAWRFAGTGMMCYGHGSSSISAGTSNANLKSLANNMAGGNVTLYYKSAAGHFCFYTEKAITGVRLYTYTSTDNVTVSNVYITNSASTSSTPSSGAVSYEAVYNDDNEALRSGTNGGCGWVEITFASEVPAGKYGQINLSSNVYIAGMALISGSSAGASLTTTLAFATTGTVEKTQGAANFTNAASTTGDNANTLGAITYSSSNTSCATVNATTGEVTITATGSSDLSTTITATLAASGCFKGATTTYTIAVAGTSCTDVAGTATAEDLGCDGMELTLSGYTDGASIQWYKDGVSMGSSYQAATCTVTVAGSYYAVTNKDCERTSNTIKLADKTVTATKLVDSWYVKNGRRTPDIALVQTEGAESFTVAYAGSTTIWDEANSNTTGFAGCGFEMDEDGVIYLKGMKADGAAPSGLTEGDTTITITASVCGKTASVNIVLHKQIATDKHVLAFVVTGTQKGDFTAGLSADQTTNVGLYNTLTENFDVLATNIYSTDDEQKLKEYYSQFDILCITDYPNTKTKGANSKSYVDAIGALIDIRPILTMEAWVSGLSNWKSKGISGTPHSPSTRQYDMLLQCKDHEIFSGTNLTKIGEGDETMYRVDMVDNTLENYATLDGYTPGSKDYDAEGKPALQGFEYTSSMSDLLPIGLIDDGKGNDLQVGIERQHVMEARLLVLGVNSYAMERLTDDGEKIIVNALKYLMKKDAEDISDCSVYFDDTEGDHRWANPGNWGPSHSSVPLPSQEARIYKPCIVDTIVKALGVKIITDGKYKYGTETANGKITIRPNGTLIVDGKIYAATAPYFYEKRATEPENLVVMANADSTGTLIFDNKDGETQATVEMYSKSYWELQGGKYVKYWSYVGMPVKDVHIPDYFYNAFTYYYNETKGWEKRFDNDIMQPFEGIGLSQDYTDHKEILEGTLVSTENVDLPLSNTENFGEGDNLISNSWTAPIQIANFDAEDFGTAWASVYIFNTGKRGRTYVNATAANDGASTAGQWLGIPIGVAGLSDYTGLKVIPAMQGFLVHNPESATTTIHLDYDKLVRGDIDTLVKYEQINEPMRAPRQARPKKKKDVDGLLRVRVAGETTLADVWMMQDDRFSEAYDNGWDTYFSPGDNRSPKLYTQSAAGRMAFLAQPDLDGTVLGFAPSRDGNDYTFTFSYRGEDEYYLNDLKLQQSVLIDAQNSYQFTYEKGDTNRFYISRTPFQAPQHPTGVDEVQQSTKAIKIIYQDKLYIIRGGHVYGADGTLVK